LAIAGTIYYLKWDTFRFMAGRLARAVKDAALPIQAHCRRRPSTQVRTSSPMPLTTIKRCQFNKGWWYTIEDCNIEVDEEPGSGLAIKVHDDMHKDGQILLSVGKEDALLIRDAINQLYPPSGKD
jgi:hypothetical protein